MRKKRCAYYTLHDGYLCKREFWTRQREKPLCHKHRPRQRKAKP